MRNWLYFAAAVGVATLVGWQEGSVGYKRGYAQAQADDRGDRKAIEATMDMVGACRWAHIAAGCPLPPGETMTNGLEQIRAWQAAHKRAPY